MPTNFILNHFFPLPNRSS